MDGASAHQLSAHDVAALFFWFVFREMARIDMKGGVFADDLATPPHLECLGINAHAPFHVLGTLQQRCTQRAIETGMPLSAGKPHRTSDSGDICS